MNWLNELYELYEKNRDLAGKLVTVTKNTKKGPVEMKLVLLPISHTTVAAQITVTIDPDGNFVKAERVAEEDKLTIIPVTEESASRTAGISPHPLCDNLKYLAGDYMDYYGGKNGKEKDYSENHRLYMKGLLRWHESDICHEKVNAVYRYMEKGCLIRDLAESGVILLDEHGKMLDKEKILGIDQMDAFVRFRILRLEELDELSLADETGRGRAECWLDRTLQECFIEYDRSISDKKGLSYLSGNVGPLSVLQPKKIRNEGDGAKLISSNDEQNFTFRGRFTDKNEAFAIGYEDSQKAHNALKWIIRKQGYSWDSLCVAVWESGSHPLPDLRSDTDVILDEYETYEGWGDDEPGGDGVAPAQAEPEPGWQAQAGPEWDWQVQAEPEQNQLDEKAQADLLGTDEMGAGRFAKAMRGYGRCLGLSSRTVLLAFDSATPGRLAMTECKEFKSSNYLENIGYWHLSCEWKHVKYKDGRRAVFTGMAGVDEIVEALYGTEQNGRLSLTGKNELYAETFKRLLPCISERRPIPPDLVRQAVRKASSPVSYKERYNWERVLAVACSLVKKQLYEHHSKEVWKVALDKNCDKRDYLFGRLLAVADRVEYRTYAKEETRETNAQRYMAAFAQKPMRTWKVLEEKLQPYWQRLNPGERLKYKHLIEDIFDLFTVEAFGSDESLSGLYLLGFHSQAIDLRLKQEQIQEEGE